MSKSPPPPPPLLGAKEVEEKAAAAAARSSSAGSPLLSPSDGGLHKQQHVAPSFKDVKVTALESRKSRVRFRMGEVSEDEKQEQTLFKDLRH